MATPQSTTTCATSAGGHWRIRPHDVEVVVDDLPAKEVVSRRDEILAEIKEGYPSPQPWVPRYAAEDLDVC